MTTLVIMCKRPRLHQGKQRLAETIGAQKAFKIAKALLTCALEDADHWQGDTVLAIAHQEDIDWAASQHPSSQVLWQGEGNLGQKLNHIDQTLRKQGHQRLVFIGTDAPALNSSHYDWAKQALTENDITLCPADDGGVVLMANSQPWPDIEALPWSSEQLGEALASCCVDAGLSVAKGPGSFDIDVEAELERLALVLGGDERSARLGLLGLLK